MSFCQPRSSFLARLASSSLLVFLRTSLMSFPSRVSYRHRATLSGWGAGTTESGQHCSARAPSPLALTCQLLRHTTCTRGPLTPSPELQRPPQWQGHSARDNFWGKAFHSQGSRESGPQTEGQGQCWSPQRVAHGLFPCPRWLQGMQNIGKPEAPAHPSCPRTEALTSSASLVIGYLSRLEMTSNTAAMFRICRVRDPCQPPALSPRGWAAPAPACSSLCLPRRRDAPEVPTHRAPSPLSRASSAHPLPALFLVWRPPCTHALLSHLMWTGAED
jgi:hypothetical protein